MVECCICGVGEPARRRLVKLAQFVKFAVNVLEVLELLDYLFGLLDEVIGVLRISASLGCQKPPDLPLAQTDFGYIRLQCVLTSQ